MYEELHRKKVKTPKKQLDLESYIPSLVGEREGEKRHSGENK